MRVLRDCERILDSVLGQPANTLTAFAFVFAGVLIIRRSRLRWVGIALAATGVGSILFHGPMPPYSEWAHDVTLAWFLLTVAGVGRSWESWTRIPGVAALGATFAFLPPAGEPVIVGLTVLALLALVTQDRSWATFGPLLLLGVSSVVGRLGATGGPLCNPESLLQPHALWHLGSAFAVAWWSIGRHAKERLPRSASRSEL